jgi:2-polyprenyl-6-methoxyphenol hydroxylase-like FAD-dependent oxidoreductase
VFTYLFSQGHILANIVPQLPPSLQAGVRTFLEKDRLKKMPNSFLPPTRQAKAGAVKEGVVLIGDSWNMRHPLTGGGMTVALGDVALLAPALVALGPGELGLGDWDRVRHVLQEWEDTRRPMASTINILSVALYDLFGAEGGNFVSWACLLAEPVLQMRPSTRSAQAASSTLSSAETVSADRFLFFLGTFFASFSFLTG